MTEFQCTSCGGNRVLCDAWVSLNDAEDVRTFDQTYCEDCDGECSVREVEVLDEPEPQSQPVIDEQNCTHFEMFTDAGNRMVAQLVKNAVAMELDWATVRAQLHELAKNDQYGEATDSSVREIVFWAIGAERRGERYWA
jgi:hypothetical protein